MPAMFIAIEIDKSVHKDQDLCNRLVSMCPVDIFEISENINLGQRVKAFKFEIKVNNKWQTIEKGTTIGSKRLIRFSNNNIQGLRISILDSKDVPLISELGLYSSN